VLAVRNRHDAIPTPAGCNQILLPSILHLEAINRFGAEGEPDERRFTF
jgi:hypothetical protein